MSFRLAVRKFSPTFPRFSYRNIIKPQFRLFNSTSQATTDGSSRYPDEETKLFFDPRLRGHTFTITGDKSADLARKRALAESIGDNFNGVDDDQKSTTCSRPVPKAGWKRALITCGVFTSMVTSLGIVSFICYDINPDLFGNNIFHHHQRNKIVNENAKSSGIHPSQLFKSKNHLFTRQEIIDSNYWNKMNIGFEGFFFLFCGVFAISSFRYVRKETTLCKYGYVSGIGMFSAFSSIYSGYNLRTELRNRSFWVEQKKSLFPEEQ